MCDTQEHLIIEKEVIVHGCRFTVFSMNYAMTEAFSSLTVNRELLQKEIYYAA